jgi:outer membrane protein OmpA-like peptidoglycan-associated protein
MMIAVALPTVASAQDLDAQTFDPAVDGREFVRLDDSVVGAYGVGGGVLFNYADDPLVFRYDDGTRSEQRVLGSIATADLLGYYNLKPFRVGIALPVQAFAASGSEDYTLEGPTLLGDLRLDVKAELLDRANGSLGAGVAVRGLIPTGNEEAWVGQGTFGVQALALLSYGESWIGTINAGFGTGNGTQLGDLTVGNQMLWGAGISVPVDERARVSAELTGALYLGAESVSGAGPIEALTAFKFNPSQDFVVSLGAGGGLTPGIGAPDFRVVSGLSWTPGFSGGAARDATLYTASSGTSDRDGDGIVDAVDVCPDQPEDKNGKADTDGCPDGNWTPTTIRILDARGGQVSGANIAFVQGPMTGEWHTTDGVLTRSLSPGNYQVQVMAEGFALSVASVDVPTAEQHEATVRLIPGQAPDARVVLHVTDIDGKAVPASVRVLGVKGRRVRGESDGVVEFPIEAGAYELVVHAPGYGTARRTVKVEANGSASIDIVLKRARVEITDKRIVILDKIFFEIDSDVIKADSFSILDEVVESLLTNGAITLLEVQGHTDDQGKEDYNLGLSQRRAEAVIKYLVASGVQPQRVVARGYGEAKPLQPGEADEARAANRRVEFHILRRAKPLETRAVPAPAPAKPLKKKKKRKR